MDVGGNTNSSTSAGFGGKFKTQVLVAYLLDPDRVSYRPMFWLSSILVPEMFSSNYPLCTAGLWGITSPSSR